VVVANIQMRTLKAEVEKGSVRTAIGHGLVDPKALGNSVQKVCRMAFFISLKQGDEAGDFFNFFSLSS